MAESGMEPKKEEQEEGVCARLEKLAQEELGETEEVESLKKPSLFLLFTFYFREC